MWLSISAAVGAAAIAVLVFFAVRTLLTAEKSMDQANRTLIQMQHEVAKVSRETTALLLSGERLSEEIRQKLAALDPLAATVRNTGEAVEQVTRSVKQVTDAVAQTAAGAAGSINRNRNLIQEAAGWAASGLQLWKAWQSEKNAKPKPDSQEEQ